MHFIAPRRPTQNGYIETFHAKLREECLNLNIFRTITHATQILAACHIHYNHERPHSALQGQSPAEFRPALRAQATSLS